MTEHDARWQKLKDILADALEAPPEERAALLDQRCGDDAELRAELEAVIAADTATHLLDQPLPLVAITCLSKIAENSFQALCCMGNWRLFAWHIRIFISSMIVLVFVLTFFVAREFSTLINRQYKK